MKSLTSAARKRRRGEHSSPFNYIPIPNETQTLSGVQEETNWEFVESPIPISRPTPTTPTPNPLITEIVPYDEGKSSSITLDDEAFADEILDTPLETTTEINNNVTPNSKINTTSSDKRQQTWCKYITAIITSTYKHSKRFLFMEVTNAAMKSFTGIYIWTPTFIKAGIITFISAKIAWDIYVIHRFSAR